MIFTLLNNIVSILKVKQLQAAVNISTLFQAGFSSVLSAPVTASWEHDPLSADSIKLRSVNMYPWLIHQMLLEGSTWPPGACEALWHYTAFQQTSAASRTQVGDVMSGATRAVGWNAFFCFVFVFVFSVCKENFILNSKYSRLSQNKENQVNSLLFVLQPKITRHWREEWLTFACVWKQRPHLGSHWERRHGGSMEWTWSIQLRFYLLPTLEQEAERKTQAFSLFLFSQCETYPASVWSSVCFSY